MMLFNWTQADVDAREERLKRDPEGVADSTLKKSRQLGVTPILCPTLDTIVLEFQGKVPSKKNGYMPRKDRPGMFKSSKLQGKLDKLEYQIPAQYRDLLLEHPDIDFFITYTVANFDRDNMQTTLLDILVSYGVLKNDNIAHCNGRMTMHPAERGEDDMVRVVITPKKTLY